MKLTETNRPTSEALGSILILSLVLLVLLAWVWQNHYGGINSFSAGLPSRHS